MTSLQTAPLSVLEPPFSQVERAGEATLRRTVTVQPGMCGPTQSLVARVGDWTWETVSALCGLDVFNARDARGRPAYLAFGYYRIKSGSGFHPKQLTFGDRLEVHSTVFDADRRALLTLHRLRRLAADEGWHDSGEVEPMEGYTRPRSDCLYVENLNMWVARGKANTNVGLKRSPPVGFHHAHLPPLPDEHSPHGLVAEARNTHRIPDPATAHWPSTCPDVTIDYPVDINRDVNGVGLLYFASFFSIAEEALLRLWQLLDRPTLPFLERTIHDARICYLGNADLNATLQLRLHTTHNPSDPREERTEILMHDTSTDRTIAVAAFRHSTKA